MMKSTVRYLIIQLKRMLYRFPSVFTLTWLLMGATLLVGAGILEEKLSEEAQKKLEVGIVGDITDSYLDFGILALQQLDSSRFTVNFHMMSEEAAKRALGEGKLTAYLVVPDGFVDSVVSGENFRLKYYTCNGQMGLGTLLMNELTSIVSELIIQSQNAIYGMQDVCLDYGMQDVYWAATDELNLKYIDIILSRTDFFEVDTLGLSNELSTQGYYVCGFTVLFFLLFGINGCPIFVRKDMSMAKLLSAKGLGAARQIVSEFLAYLMFSVVNMLGVFVLLGGVASQMSELVLPEWRTVSFERIMSFGVSLMPAFMMLTAMAFLGYELSDNIVSGMLLQFLLTFSMGYVSGCFYPSSFFPEGIRFIGRLLPSGVAIQYASECMRSELSTSMMLGVAVYTIMFLGGAYLLRKRKLA